MAYILVAPPDPRGRCLETYYAADGLWVDNAKNARHLTSSELQATWERSRNARLLGHLPPVIREVY